MITSHHLTQHSVAPLCALTRWDGPPSLSTTAISGGERVLTTRQSIRGASNCSHCDSGMPNKQVVSAPSRHHGAWHWMVHPFQTKGHSRQEETIFSRGSAPCDWTKFFTSAKRTSGKSDCLPSSTDGTPFVLDLLMELRCHHHRNKHHKETTICQNNLDDPTYNLIWEQSKILTSASVHVTLPKPIAITMTLAEFPGTPWWHRAA